jgi:hypothetical protein
MSYLIVSPDMHKVHHHYKPIPTVITEYILRLGPSFRDIRTLPKEEIVYGIDTHMKNENTMN